MVGIRTVVFAAFLLLVSCSHRIRNSLPVPPFKTRHTIEMSFSNRGADV